MTQRFDCGGPFDGRFDEVLAPAIRAADIEPDRTDRGPPDHGADRAHRKRHLPPVDERARARRAPRVRLFVSHAHRDADRAQRLVECLVAGLDVPDGALRCTSVAGYQLDLGTMAPDALRRELGSSACVVALLTPNSIGNDWVLFELGAAWSNASGGLDDELKAGFLAKRARIGARQGQLLDHIAAGAIEIPVVAEVS